MLLLALFIAGVSGQASTPASAVTAPAASSEVYAPPAVRPYEPPSNFGRQIAEGDADASVRTRPIAAPVAVEAYSNTYEPAPSRGEISYEQGVETARIRQNARMGSLDGVWRVLDQSGRPILDLVLSDRGAGLPVEGALRLTRTERTAPVEVAAEADGRRLVTAALGDARVALRLSPDGAAWAGELAVDGKGQAVTLTRPDGWAP